MKVAPIFLNRNNWFSRVYEMDIDDEWLDDKRVIDGLEVWHYEDHDGDGFVLDTPGGALETFDVVVL